MIYPLAIYTAEHGLEWKYPVDEIGYAELDRCRTLLGSIPDFDAGDEGYEGYAVVGERVFVLRCFRVQKWDFRGRDAIYLAVTWFDRSCDNDVEALLRASALNVPTHDPERHFTVEAKQTSAAYTDGERARRSLSGGDWQRWYESSDVVEDVVAAGNDEPIRNKIPEKTDSPFEVSSKSGRPVNWWVVIGAIVAVLLVFLVDVISKRILQKEHPHDGGREVSHEACAASGTNTSVGVTGEPVHPTDKSP